MEDKIKPPYKYTHHFRDMFGTAMHKEEDEPYADETTNSENNYKEKLSKFFKDNVTIQQIEPYEEQKEFVNLWNELSKTDKKVEKNINTNKQKNT
jgi:Skp family chaperone for outer membrane proteins